MKVVRTTVVETPVVGTTVGIPNEPTIGIPDEPSLGIPIVISSGVEDCVSSRVEETRDDTDHRLTDHRFGAGFAAEHT